MDVEKALENEIDVYGNALVDITLRFVRNEINLEERTALYRKAGDKHRETIKAKIEEAYEEGKIETLKETTVKLLESIGWRGDLDDFVERCKQVKP